jgi:hypothetical protein
VRRTIAYTIVGAVALFALIQCFFEEARFTITNPQALRLVLGDDYAHVRSARLFEYTGNKATLVMEGAARSNTLRGKIDMLGRKTWTETDYPLRFDFVSNNLRIRLIQPKPSPNIQVVVDG